MRVSSAVCEGTSTDATELDGAVRRHHDVIHRQIPVGKPLGMQVCQRQHTLAHVLLNHHLLERPKPAEEAGDGAAWNVLREQPHLALHVSIDTDHLHEVLVWRGHQHRGFLLHRSTHAGRQRLVGRRILHVKGGTKQNGRGCGGRGACTVRTCMTTKPPVLVFKHSFITACRLLPSVWPTWYLPSTTKSRARRMRACPTKCHGHSTPTCRPNDMPERTES